MHRFRFAVGLAAFILAVPVLADGPAIVDDFENTESWSVLTSDGVAARLSSVEGSTGKALRLDYDFQGHFGYVVLRRELKLSLPDNYRFVTEVRGTGEANNLEFKLVGGGGENVWWHVRRDWAYPSDWSPVTVRKRQIQFAWGPSRETPLTEVSALELAVSTGMGGKGWLELDTLTVEALQPARPIPPVATFGTHADRNGESTLSSPMATDMDIII